MNAAHGAACVSGSPITLRGIGLAYPPDVLTDDAPALLRPLGLGAGEYDLGGYSESGFRR